MPLPTMGPLAAENYQQLEPLATGAPHGYALANFVAALCGPIEDVAGWVAQADDEPGYAILLDLGRAPTIALPWLAQFKGVRITPGLSDAATRDEIANAEGFHRGTVPSLIAAGQRHLTGTRSVRIIERTGPSVYDLLAITRTSETPDPTVTLADLMAAKRIGIRLTHVVTDDVLWADATVVWDDVDPGVAWDDVVLADVT